MTERQADIDSSIYINDSINFSLSPFMSISRETSDANDIEEIYDSSLPSNNQNQSTTTFTIKDPVLPSISVETTGDGMLSSMVQWIFK